MEKCRFIFVFTFVIAVVADAGFLAGLVCGSWYHEEPKPPVERQVPAPRPTPIPASWTYCALTPRLVGAFFVSRGTRV